MFAILKRLSSHTFVADVASLLSSNVITIILSIVGSIIVARVLGPENRGLIAAVLVVPTMVLSFADLGLRQAATFYLGKRIYDDQSVISTLAFLLGVTTCLSLIVTLGIYVWSGFPSRYGWTAMALGLSVIPFSLCLSYGSGVLLGKQRIHQLAIREVLVSIAYLIVLLLLLVSQHFDVQGVLFATLLSKAIGAIFVVAYVKQYGNLSIRYIQGLPWDFLKRGFTYALALFVLGLNYRLDIILLERLSNAHEVGLYAVGVSLAELLWLLPTALRQVNFSRSAAAKDPYEYAKKVAMVMRVVLLGALPLCACLYVFAPWIISVIYGQSFAGSGVIVQALLPGVWANLIFKILNSDLAGRGKPLVACWIYGAAVALNVVLNIIWIPRYGAVGSGWATSVSYCVGALVYAVVYARISRLTLFELFMPKKSDLHKFIPQKG